mgnify:CR=1 FL=1
MSFKWKDLDDKLRRITDAFTYLAVDDDGMVTVYIGPVDKYEPIPSYTGLNFDHNEVLQKIKNREKNHA